MDTRSEISQHLSRRGFLQTMGAAGVALGGLGLSGCVAGSPGRASGSKQGTLRIAASDGSPNDTMNPLQMQTTFQILTVPQVYEALIDLDEGFQPHGRLAQSFGTADQGRTWTFHLQPDVTFHDGSAFTAHDVAYSIARAIDPKSGSANSLASQLSGFLTPGGIKVLDKHTIRFELLKPYVFFPGAMGTRFARIYKTGTTDFARPVGTGPFRFTSFEPGKRWSGQKNPDYWRNTVTLDGLTVTNVADETSRISALLTDEVDFIFEISLASAPDVASSSSHTLLEQKAAQWPALGIDSTHPPFDNPDLIRAIKLGLDRDQIISNAYGGYATMGYDNPISDVDPYFAGLPKPAHDPAGARAALAQAGYRKGITLPILLALDDPNVTNLAVVMKNQLQSVGITLDIKRDPAATYWDNTWLKRPFYSNTYLRRHPDEILKLVALSSGTWNMSKWHDPQVDAAIEAAGSTTDFAEQKKQYGIAQRLISGHDTMVVPAHLSRLSGMTKKVSGIRTNFVTFLDVDRATLG